MKKKMVHICGVDGIHNILKSKQTILNHKLIKIKMIVGGMELILYITNG